MPNLTERERIEILIMVAYGDRLQTHQEATYLIKNILIGPQSDLHRGGRPNLDQETKLNILLEAEENPHAFTRQLLLNNDSDHSTLV
ncbi:hypothetical protein ILUMI_26689 [Ignelater luminosus]|uniref:Uncharacterized protein n=1 Tax=Ignelater luminosus TaxID=2038154 RepID=A0A8K0FYW9_IGNLU|nr:hypothetical protein ILUMI_26689 [Ignelater luminosus]